MAYILNIETATKNCSVAIAKDGSTIYCREAAEQGYSHAEKLHVFIKEALVETGLSFQDLSAIAVSQGPGSYTGLRIGISAAKGLCFALDIPMISVDTLAVLTAQVNITEGFIVPMIDARRMEVYSAIFNADKVKIREVQAEVLNELSFTDIDAPIYFAGDCLEKCKTVLTEDNFNFLDNICFPSANHMGMLSFDKYKKNDTVDVAYFEPYYLKDFISTVKKGS